MLDTHQSSPGPETTMREVGELVSRLHTALGFVFGSIMNASVNVWSCARRGSEKSSVIGLFMAFSEQQKKEIKP